MYYSGGLSGNQYAGGLGAGGGSSNPFNWKGAAGAIGGGLAGFMGGQGMADGYGQMNDQINNAMNTEQQYYDQGNAYLQPYYDQGTQAFGQYGKAIGGMANAPGYVNDIMGQYSESPMAKFQMQEGQRASNNAAAASGQLGSPAQQMALQRYGQGVSSQDQQRYFGNVTGVNNQYLSGLKDQFGMGYGAAGEMNRNRMGLADNLTELLQNLGISQMNQGAASSGGLGDLMGMAGSLASFF